MSTTPTISDHLATRFDNQRIVVWQDAEGEFSSDLEKYAPNDVTVLRVDNDEFQIKYRVLRQDPTTKFLIYRSGVTPEGLANWLLDIELVAGAVFTANRDALMRVELGLTAPGSNELIAQHPSFFGDAMLVAKLKALPLNGEDLIVVQAQMCAVLLRQNEHSFSELTRTVLMQQADAEPTGFEALTRHGLADFFWEGAFRFYGYQSQSPSIAGFTLWMIQQAAGGFRLAESKKARNLAIDFRGFRDSKRSGLAMKTLAKDVERNVDYAEQVAEIPWETLLSADIYEVAEREIIRRLIDGIRTQTMSLREITEAIGTRRRESVWFEDYAVVYEGLSAAAELLPMIRSAHFEITDFADGLAKYRDEWFRIDQRYRQFTKAYFDAEFKQPLEELAEQVEKAYVADFLAPLGVSWQQQVDLATSWRTVSMKSQSAFYEHYVADLLGSHKKAVVIISDAMRYEVAEELSIVIQGENKFSASIDAMLGVLPSYTKLGMASLLPHETLAHSEKGDLVLADGQKSNNTENRSKILSAVGGAAIQAKDFVEMNKGARRELYASNQVLYVYHDMIDATGDKAVSEHRTFKAAAEAIFELIDIVKKLANANATNIFITADHGFLYQRSPVAEQFKLTEKPQGEQIIASSRRYVLGRGLKESTAFKKFTAEQVGLASDLEIQIPNSIQRIAQPGAGNQFVHGGASLQEIVVPVIQVNKRRSDTVAPVNVAIHPESNLITTGQLVVNLYQSNKVEPNRPARRLRAGLYFGDQLISNEQELTFDSQSEEGRDRFQQVTLLLSRDANAANNQNVEFRLSEPISGTDQWKKYEIAPYTIKRAFASDDGWDF